MSYRLVSWARLAVLSFSLLALPLVQPGCASGSAEDTGPRLDGTIDGRDARLLDVTLSCETDADCMDGDACNGNETCLGGSCVVGVEVDCDDGVGCTADTCDIGTGACANAIDDSRCAASLVCDPIDDCSAPRPCDDDAGCDDGVFCNGPERCDLAFGCRRGDAPSCDDGIACSADSCDASSDACTNTPDAMRCSDGLVCNGPEVCAPGSTGADGEGCAPGTPPVCDDSVGCTVDGCDEAAAGCASVPTNAMCDDGVFCNGAETCDATMDCLPGTTPACEDAIGCTVGRCDATSDACAQDPNPAACSDGRACNGTEVCDTTGTTPGLGCVAGAPVNCSDGIACTTDSCTEPGTCNHGGSDFDSDTYTASTCAGGNDCDDLNPRVHPGAAELCDGIDNDCSATGPAGIDDGPGMQCAFGSPPRACTTTCGTAGTAPCDGACRLGTCRAATETCNGCDDDGDGQIDEPGGGSPVMCRSGDVQPCTTTCGTLGTRTCTSGCAWGACAAAEVCNSCDDDGDGMVDEGFTLGGSCSVGVGTCARSGSVVCRSDGTGTSCSATPGAAGTESCNGLDDDCDGVADEPFTELGTGCNSGVGACRRSGVFVCRTDGVTTTCSATPSTPGLETCNSIDDDCDGVVDDGADGGPCDGPDGDLCLEGINRCTGGTLVCDDGTGTITEICNGIDDNCNGTTDEGCACTLGMNRSCYTGPMGTQDVGRCRAGSQTCVAGPGGVGSEWGSCSGAVLPATETCNATDDNCNGTTDEGNPGGGTACDGADGDLCAEGTFNCTGGTLVCSDVTPTNVETCNGADDNCNGSVDEGNPGGGAACDGMDGDLCNEGTLSCSGGTLVCSDVTPTNVETCNNIDDNCNGSIDEGNPGGGAACDGMDTDLCQEGTFNCSSGVLACSDATGSTVEICGNGIDDDCSGGDAICTTPPNDQCAGAITLSGTGGTRMDTLVGATAQTSDCGSGVEVFYRVTVSAPTLVYLSTLGSAAFDTRLSYRGTSCAGTAVQCVDDSCGVLQTQLVQLVPAGTHYFAVHTYSSFTTPGAFGLSYGIYAAGGGTNTLVPLGAAGSTANYSSGAATGTSMISSPGCTTFATGPENSYYWLQCTADSRTYTASTCTGTTYDSVAYVRLNGANIGCNDDSCGLQSRITTTAAAGAGVVQAFIDGYNGASGAYTAAITF